MSKWHRGGRWQRVSLAVRERDGWRCTQCGKAGRLEAHHIKPVHLGGDDSPSNLRTLCREHHLSAHRPQLGPRAQAWQTLLKEKINA